MDVAIPRGARKADLVKLVAAEADKRAKPVEKTGGDDKKETVDEKPTAEPENSKPDESEKSEKSVDLESKASTLKKIPPPKVTKPRPKIPKPKRIPLNPPSKPQSPPKPKLKDLLEQTVPQKRSLENESDDANSTTVHKEYSQILKKQTNHKRVFSSSAPTTPNNSVIESPKKSTLKLESSPQQEIKAETPEASRKSSRKNTPKKPVNSSPKSPAQKEVFKHPADDTSFVIPTLPSSTPMAPKSPQKHHQSLNVSNFAAQLEKLSGPTKQISPDKLSSPPPKSPDTTDDDAMLTQLQHEIDITQEQIEVQSKQALKAIEAPPPSNLAYRLGLVWFLTLSLMYAFTCYREQRIRTGFCGFEVYRPLFNYDRRSYSGLTPYLDSIENLLSLNCVPCPEHGQCFPYSKLFCDADYTVHKPIKSLFGLLPTFQTCVLDSAKVKKIDKMVKLSTDLLNRRNAEYKCGRGEDQDVGLTLPHLQNYLIERLDIKDDGFDYLWEKTLNVLENRPELVITNDFIRSNSLSKLSIKCRLIRMFMDVFIRFRWHLLGLVFIAATFKYISIRFTRYRTERKLVNELTTKVIEKLHKQAELHRLGKSSLAYIGKIQLRDYYLIDASLSAKQKTKVWDRVSKLVETNTNVKTYMTEVRGEMFKVWEWIATI
ncbi:hypothetical protein OGAPHI_006622 [Ogataea philodendri]|uniref:Man1/Src1-like C-terminal domain-containing protein n=1 Tax=Ogataea philodendri TaxID=1378263 RepID=A0A9P8NWU8_9ASCO|nr:uncharacterized protein OGAPHI_006622 [Ogataea philodendri]KAH3661215.1 hypothetical protein OGAPHI_006622 [Ogataea philodendri]